MRSKEPEVVRAYNKEYRKLNKKKIAKQRHDKYNKNRENILAEQRAYMSIKRYYLKRYGITVEQYNKMLDKQKGLCAICKQPETQVTKNGDKFSLAVDHCHATGATRKLLCHACNRGLGLFHDNWKTLLAASKYMKAFK